VPDLLIRLVKDRDSSVRFAAVEAAIAHGDGRLIIPLQQAIDSAKTSPGTREYALAAIAAISARES
jgi:HEAT repeat protein